MVEISDQISRDLEEFMLLPAETPEEFSIDRVDLSSPLTKYEPGKEEPKIKLNIPFLAAAMQAVTGVGLVNEATRNGAGGVYFRSQEIESQAAMVRETKRARSGFASMLEVLNPSNTVGDVKELIADTGYSTIPVVTGDKTNFCKLLGFIDGSTALGDDNNKPVSEIMRPFRKEPLIEIIEGMVENKDEAASIIRAVNDHIHFGNSNMTLNQATEVLMETKRKYLPIINNNGDLKYIVFRKDVETQRESPLALLDENQKYIAAAAIDTMDYQKRAPPLAEAGVDILFIDSSDGHKHYQKECIEWLKHNFKHIPVVGGNVITAEGFRYLVYAGADAVKIGMGIGSICTTSEVKPVGRGQFAAIWAIARARNQYFQETGIYIPLIGDGGVRNAMHMGIALAIGADSVMMGSYFAGTEESPTKAVNIDGTRYKPYWGEGSQRAREWIEGRYNHAKFEEGVEGLVQVTGSLNATVEETVAKIVSTFEHVGAMSIEQLRKNAIIEQVSTHAMQKRSAYVKQMKL